MANPTVLGEESVQRVEPGGASGMGEDAVPLVHPDEATVLGELSVRMKQPGMCIAHNIGPMKPDMSIGPQPPIGPLYRRITVKVPTGRNSTPEDRSLIRITIKELEDILKEIEDL